MNQEQTCRCGHAREAHEHYRPGTDCGRCGSCQRYQPQAAALPAVATTIRRLRRDLGLI